MHGGMEGVVVASGTYFAISACFFLSVGGTCFCTIMRVADQRQQSNNVSTKVMSVSVIGEMSSGPPLPGSAVA